MLECSVSLLLLKNANAGGKAMQEVGVANRADLAVAEKAGDGNCPGSFGHGTAVVIGLTIEVGATAIAREEQYSTRWPGSQIWGEGIHQEVEILARGHGVTHVELHGLPGPEQVAYGNSAAGGIGSHEGADEKVAALKLFFILVNYPPHQECSAC